MIINKYPSLKNNKFINMLNKIFSNEYLMIFVFLVTLISNLFSLEILSLYPLMLVIVMSSLFGDDMINALPVFFCGYIMFSRRNNPATTEGVSIFRTSEGLTHLFINCSIILIFLIVRLIIDIVRNKGKYKTPKFTLGFIFIAIAFISGGMFTKYFSLHSMAIGAIQAVAWMLVYFYFYFTIDFDKHSIDYCLKLVLGLGIVLSIEQINMLHLAGFWSNPEEFTRGDLFTGWGHYNNMGGMLVITMAVPFYYACKKYNNTKYNILWLLAGNFMATMVALSQSRGAILTGVVIFIICNILMLVMTKGKIRTNLFITQVICGALVLSFISLEYETLKQQFKSLFEAGAGSINDRFEIYKRGLEQFIEYPIFGNSFIACEAFQWGDHPAFWPARYHNTYVQLLATGGIVCAMSYIFHRFQTIKTFKKNFNLETLFLGMIILSIIGVSVVDCHLFNVGPAIVYSGVLLFIEKQKVSLTKNC